MAFIPTPNTARLVLKWQGGGFDYSNVVHCTKTGFTTNDLQDLADDVSTWVGSNMLANIPDGIRWVGVDAYDMRTESGAMVSSTQSGGVGQQATEELPVSNAIVVTLRTAQRGRSGRGRLYVTFYDESDIDSGVFGQGAINLAGSYVAGVKGAIENAGWVLVIRSTQQGGVVLTTGVTIPVTSYEVRSGVPGTQRRRLDRG